MRRVTAGYAVAFGGFG